MSTLIAITGGSGAGKTTVARALARRLGAGAVVIAEDDYYRCASSIANFDAALHNFDEPAAKEHALLHAHLKLAKSGEAFDKPVYDLTTHRRRPDVERIAHADWVIVEGIHLLADPHLAALFDVSVYMQCDEALRLARRMIRDTESRGRTPRSVLVQFFAHVRPMHDKYVEPQQALADLVIPCPYDAGPEHADASAAEITALLEPRA
ncbi:MAG: dephospho-CoA kinase [Terricaulis sp.]|nr:dephospho-CoA kinase [Terricaulis sp.]